jgi:hypothetical protein
MPGASTDRQIGRGGPAGARRQRSLQNFTRSHTRSHFLRQEKGLPQRSQIRTGRSEGAGGGACQDSAARHGRRKGVPAPVGARPGWTLAGLGPHLELIRGLPDAPGPHPVFIWELLYTPGPHPALPGQLPDFPGQLPELPRQHSDRPGPHPALPGQLPDFPEQLPELPRQHSDRPGSHPELPGQLPDFPGQLPELPRQHSDRPGSHPARPGSHPARP